MSIKRKAAGEWREVGLRYRKVNGQWRQVVKSYRKVNGIWKLVYQRAAHQPHLVGLENFIGTYTVERRADGTIYCEVNGRVVEGTNAQIGLVFPGLPVPSNIDMVVADYFKSIYQENDLYIDDGSWRQSIYQEFLTNWPVNLYSDTGMMRIFINMNISYTDVRTYFKITNLRVNDIPM